MDSALHPANPGDRLLLCSDGLCSDGLSNEISEELIVSTMESEQELSASAAVLVDHAFANGGRDNITVVIAEVAA